jgi:hypothetical protein
MVVVVSAVVVVVVVDVVSLSRLCDDILNSAFLRVK